MEGDSDISKPERCPECGYSLVGIGRERCPECGLSREDHYLYRHEDFIKRSKRAALIYCALIALSFGVSLLPPKLIWLFDFGTPYLVAVVPLFLFVLVMGVIRLKLVGACVLRVTMVCWSPLLVAVVPLYLGSTQQFRFLGIILAVPMIVIVPLMILIWFPCFLIRAKNRKIKNEIVAALTLYGLVVSVACCMGLFKIALLGAYWD